MRKFETYPPDKQVHVLLFALALSLTSPDSEKKQTPDVYHRAAKNGRLHQLEPGDFDLIKDKTIDELTKNQ